jgi:two-component system KDP operon response regulator KdpE
MFYRVLPNPQAMDTALPTQATILIVEDEADLRRGLGEMLSLFGYRVITAATVREAEEARQARAGEGLDLIIADIHLTPDFTAYEGYMLFQQWTAVDADARFILMSGDASSLELPAIRTGAVPFLLKPLTASELLQAVRAVLGESMA